MRAFLFSRKWKICCRIIPHLGGLKNVPRRTVRQQIVSIKNFRRQIFLCKIYKPKSKRKIPKNIQNGAHIFPISDKNADFFRYVLGNIVCRIAADFWGKIKRRRLDNQRLSLIGIKRKYPRGNLYFNVFFVVDVWKPKTKEL